MIKTNFLGDEVPKENEHYTCIACITINSIMRMGKKNYPQVYLEECKCKIKKSKTTKSIEAELESESESESELDWIRVKLWVGIWHWITVTFSFTVILF